MGVAFPPVRAAKTPFLIFPKLGTLEQGLPDLRMAAQRSSHFVTPVSVVVIEDNRLLRNSIATIVAKEPDLKVRATASGANEALQRIQDIQPQVVLLDSALAEHKSLLLVHEVKRAAPTTKVIVTDLQPVQDKVIEFVRAGVSGFILKDATAERVVRTIRSVVKGSYSLPPTLAGALLTYVRSQAYIADKMTTLDAIGVTKREGEVVELIAGGLSTRQMAERLRIAPYTVRSHVHNIMEKLRVHTRLEIAAYAHGNRGQQR
jgi:DNA-binding NarL/FixJ family response regulator